MLPRPCLEQGCPQLAEAGHSRCRPHRLERDRPRWRHHVVRRRQAVGDGAAARLRRLIRSDGGGPCARCRHVFEASDLEVDHIVPLIDGGTDYDDNVQALCIACHKQKTKAEARQRARGPRPGQR